MPTLLVPARLMARLVADPIESLAIEPGVVATLESIPENRSYGFKLILQKIDRQLNVDFKGKVAVNVRPPFPGTVIELVSGADDDIIAFFTHDGRRFEATYATDYFKGFVKPLLEEPRFKYEPVRRRRRPDQIPHGSVSSP